MRKNNFFLKSLLFAGLLLGGASSAWADGTISIPQDMGSYIVLGSATGTENFASYISTKTNCSIDSRLGDAENNKYYTIGTTLDQTSATFAIDVTTSSAGTYVFGFKTGAANDAASTVNITIKKSGESESTIIATAETVVTDSNWDPNKEHVFYVSDLDASATYTITLAITKTGGRYCGNFGQFYFHSSSQYDAFPVKAEPQTYIDIEHGSYTGSIAYESTDSNAGSVGNLKNGGTAVYTCYVATAGRYLMHMSEKYYGIGTMTVTITDKVTGTAEVTQVFDVPSFDSFTDYEFPFFTDLTTGIKDIQLVFNGTGNDWGYICNYKDIFFESYEIASHYNALPMYGTSVLDTNSGSINTSSGAPRAETQSGTIYTQIGFVNKDTYADDYYVYISGNETAYYDLRTNISYYNNGGTFKLTITDVTTHTKEVDAQESATITAKGNIVLPITNALTPGLKKIRFDFVNDDATTYLFNLKDICFYKRSLNESYDYTPAAASNVDVVLTRSITANNWSTICLPFALTSEQLTSTFGSGVKVAELSESGTDENTLSFSSVTSTTANKPYAIKVASDFTSATISGVTIEEGTPTQSVGDWEFIGTYSTVSNLAEGNFYIKSNSLYQATGTQSVKPFRGYFHYKGSGSPRQVSFFVDSETSVESVQAAETTDKASAFDLQGRRVNESHLTRGMYIVNGKKMIVR